MWRASLLTAGVIAALVLSLIALWGAFGSVKEPVRPHVAERGTWCCAGCTPGSLKCTKCQAVPVGGCSETALPTEKVDCPGNTTETIDGTVTCY